MVVRPCGTENPETSNELANRYGLSDFVLLVLGSTTIADVVNSFTGSPSIDRGGSLWGVLREGFAISTTYESVSCLPIPIRPLLGPHRRSPEQPSTRRARRTAIILRRHPRGFVFRRLQDWTWLLLSDFLPLTVNIQATNIRARTVGVVISGVTASLSPAHHKAPTGSCCSREATTYSDLPRVLIRRTADASQRLRQKTRMDRSNENDPRANSRAPPSACRL